MKLNYTKWRFSFARLGQYLVLISFVILIQACTKDSILVKIKFNLVYGEDPLVMLNDYVYPDGRKIRFTRVSFFISEMMLHSDNGSEMITEIEHLNFTNSNQDLTSAEQGYLFFDGEVDLDAINELSFNIGLTEAMNETVPADYSPDHPLSNSGEYWIGWESFIFAKIEGWVDLDGDGNAETSMALHLGSNNVRQNINLAIPSGPNEINLEIDVEKIFDNNGIYNIANDPQIHSLSQLEAIMQLAGNLSHSIKLK